MEQPRNHPVPAWFGYLVWGGTAYVALIAYVLSRTRGLFWDEVPYHSQVSALATASTFRSWLVDNAVIPTGPLHALMNYWLSGGHGDLSVPWVRAPNLVLLGLSILLIAFSLKRLGYQSVAALAVLAVPMTWVVSGIAITEPLAMCGISLALAGVVIWNTRSDDAVGSIGAPLLIAVGLAIATTTRQTYLAAIPGLLLLAGRNARSMVVPAAAMLIGTVPILLLFKIWGGLVPPKLAFTDAGLRFAHGYLCLAITGVAVGILAPAVYWRYRWWSTAVAGVAVVMNELFAFVAPTTLTSVQRFLGHPWISRMLEKIAAAVIVGAGAAFCAAVALHCWERRDRITSGALLVVLAMSASCVAITHQFSSRYAVMALPFLVVALAPSMDFGRWAVVRSVVGSVLGLAILHSYYVFA